MNLFHAAGFSRMRRLMAFALTIVILSGFFSVIQIVFFKALEPLIGPSRTIMISLLFIGFLFFGTPFARRVQKWINSFNKFDYEETLKEAGRAIVSTLELDQLLRYLVRCIKTSLGVEHVCFYLREKEGLYQRQQDPPEVGICCPDSVLDRVLVEWVRRTGQILIREGLEQGKPEDEFRLLRVALKQTGAELVIPLLFKGNLAGILTLGKKGNFEAYSGADFELLEVMAGHAAVAIENARLYENARQVQESLRESEERFRSLVEATSDWVWEMNERGVYTYVSPKIRDTLGYEADEVLGKTFFDFMPREEARRTADAFVLLTKQKQPYRAHKKTCLHKSGRIVILETSGMPVFGPDGAFLGYRGIDRDVTERSELEGQLRYAQKMEAIGRLTAGIAHDYNNINTAVIGYASLIQLNMDTGDPMAESVDQILKATERAAKLTRTLLDFGRKPVMKLRPVHLNALIAGTTKTISGIVPNTVEFRFNPAGPEDIFVNADPLEIERVLINLVSNARDAMPDGGRLTLETRSEEMNDEFITSYGYGKPGRYVRLIVSDTGTGMDEQTVKKIFQPFFTTKGAGKGTGFGLAIVYDIVKQHGGYINVASAPEKGASFSIYLPLMQDAPYLRTGTPFTTEGRSETVLVAENDDEDRHFIRAALETAGYRVVEAVDGEDALDKFGEAAIHSVIMNIIMPKMSGEEAYREIREKRPDLKILFTSRYAEDIISHNDMPDPNRNFILKPFSSKELLDRLGAMRSADSDGPLISA